MLADMTGIRRFTSPVTRIESVQDKGKTLFLGRSRSTWVSLSHWPMEWVQMSPLTPHIFPPPFFYKKYLKFFLCQGERLSSPWLRIAGALWRDTCPAPSVEAHRGAPPQALFLGKGVSPWAITLLLASTSCEQCSLTMHLHHRKTFIYLLTFDPLLKGVCYSSSLDRKIPLTGPLPTML